jgi:hypothetical protein
MQVGNLSPSLCKMHVACAAPVQRNECAWQLNRDVPSHLRGTEGDGISQA